MRRLAPLVPLLFAACAHEPAPITPAPGPLRSALESRTETLGNLELRWDDAARQVSLRVSERVVWASPIGKAFLGAARAKVSGHENRGSYRIRAIGFSEKRLQTLHSIENDGDSIRLTGSLGLKGELGYALRFQEHSNNRVRVQVSLQDGDDAWLSRLYASATPGEKVYGLGTQFSGIEFRGKDVPIWVQEQGIGRGRQPLTFLLNLFGGGAGGNAFSSYAPLPRYLTSENRGLSLQNSSFSFFSFKGRDYFAVSVHGPELEAFLPVGSSPLELVDALEPGRMKPLPDWTQRGAILGLQGGKDRVLRLKEKLQAAGVPIAGLWLQDWSGRRVTAFGKQLWWSWTPDHSLYPDWKGFVQALRREGLRVLAYVNPFLVDTSGQDRPNLFAEAKEKGFLLENDDREPYLQTLTTFDAALVDLDNPRAEAWLQGIIEREIIGAGVSGWMADFAESFPLDAFGKNGWAAHNLYPVRWAALNRRALENAKSKDLFFFSRSGFTGSAQESTAFWLGDQMVSWDPYDGLPTALKGLLSAGLSGIPLNHSDIGGYTGVSVGPYRILRTKELTMRWIELNAFTPLFRSHEGNLPEGNHQVYSDQETIAHLARFSRVFRELARYRKGLMRQAGNSGAPLVRALFLHFPEDPVASTIDDQFLLGPDLMIAPILEKGAVSRRVYLPPGDWIDAWGWTLLPGSEGRWVTYHAPLGRPPVFWRSGSRHAFKLAS